MKKFYFILLLFNFAYADINVPSWLLGTWAAGDGPLIGITDKQLTAAAQDQELEKLITFYTFTDTDIIMNKYSWIMGKRLQVSYKYDEEYQFIGASSHFLGVKQSNDYSGFFFKVNDNAMYFWSSSITNTINNKKLILTFHKRK